jgi:transcriptional regulator with XRE-family HTH domain
MTFPFPQLVRSPEALRAARQALGLSADGLARMLRVEDGRSVRRWEAGDNAIPGPVTVILEAAMSYLNKRAMISRQLKLRRAGKMRTGGSDGAEMVHDTVNTIKHLERAHEDDAGALEEILKNAGDVYASAFETLTRQPVDKTPAREVHWYHLWRRTPLHSPPAKDDWSLPGETSPEAALAHFEKHEGFEGGLVLCTDPAELSAEFMLEQRDLVRIERGSSIGLRSGIVRNTFSVKRRS